MSNDMPLSFVFVYFCPNCDPVQVVLPNRLAFACGLVDLIPEEQDDGSDPQAPGLNPP